MVQPLMTVATAMVGGGVGVAVPTPPPTGIPTGVGTLETKQRPLWSITSRIVDRLQDENVPEFGPF
jgi:hypothetical protein